MLVLSRRERERICLGDSIVVTVVRLAGDKVRLGIEAPADMLVLRGELEVLPALASGGKAARLAATCEASKIGPSDICTTDISTTEACTKGAAPTAIAFVEYDLAIAPEESAAG